MKSIFTNNKVFTSSDPLPNWIFNVEFYRHDGKTNAYSEFLKDIVATSITLPDFKTQTVTKKFFGTEKTFPVIRTYGKDVTMTFNIYSALDSNQKLDWVTQINAMRGRNYSTSERVLDELEDDLSDEKFERTIMENGHWEEWSSTEGGPLAYHPELTEVSNGYDFIAKFNAVVVCVKNKLGEPVYKLRYKNCVVTNFEFDNELNYDSDQKLRCKLTFHSDIWDFVPIEKTERVFINDDVIGDPLASGSTPDGSGNVQAGDCNIDSPCSTSN